MTEPVYDLDVIVAHVREQLPGVRCYVEQTGGGCATIYLGREYCVDELGIVTSWPSPSHGRECQLAHHMLIPVMAGPGHFEGPAWTKGRSYVEEFSCGYDACDPLWAAGLPPYIDGFGLDPVDERVVARRLAEFYRQHPRVLSGAIH